MIKQVSTILFLGLLTTFVIGCGPSQGVPMAEPVSVKGTVTAGGKPVGNVTLKLQPLEVGYEKIIPVAADGSFTVETHPGKYAFYFVPKEGTKTIPPSVSSHAEASMEHTVQVQPGQTLSITL